MAFYELIRGFLCTFEPKILYKDVRMQILGKAQTYHVPVLLDKSVSGLNIQSGGNFVAFISPAFAIPYQTSG